MYQIGPNEYTKIVMDTWMESFACVHCDKKNSHWVEKHLNKQALWIGIKVL